MSGGEKPKGAQKMDNDYFIRLSPEAFALLHDEVEEKLRERASKPSALSEILGVENVPLLELWVAIRRADKEHQCVDDGYRLQA